MAHIFAHKDPKKRAFLGAYAALGNVTSAAEAAQIARRTHYDWLEADSEYAEAFEHAKNAYADYLEAEARRRAVEGTDKPVYQGGKLVGTVREYSDTLLIFLLKGERGEKYKDRQSTELTGPGGEPLTIRIEAPGFKVPGVDG